MFDVAKLTLDEVGAEIDKCIDKLGRLQALYSAMQEQDHRRVTKLVEEYNQAVHERNKAKLAAEKEKDENKPGQDPDPPVGEHAGGGQPGASAEEASLPD